MSSDSYFERNLNLALPDNRSCFLWGARQTGKTTLLKQKFPDSLLIDFLKADTFFLYLQRPQSLREYLLYEKKKGSLCEPIILDEIQKIPALLDEVHWLIENEKLQFILCGSSARKLKRGHANLLGGRAWRYELYPLTWTEIPATSFNLLQVLNRGLLPAHYVEPDYKQSQQSYLQDYLKEEIMTEGLVRNLPAFSRLFEALAFSNTQMINYSNIARDCGVDSKTVKEYFQILEDTLIGNLLYPYSKRVGRDIISSTPKFYFFDVGLATYLTKQTISSTAGPLFGKAFEHYIFMEIKAYLAYRKSQLALGYWRTKQSKLEVDFVLGDGEIAIEVKGTANISKKDRYPLEVFNSEYQPRRSIIVYTGEIPRLIENIELLPYQHFLDELWNDRLIG